MLPVILGLLGAASPFILNHINAESARLAAEAAHRESEINKAREIFDDVNGTMDKLAYLSKAVMFSIIFRDLNEATVGEPPAIAPNGMIQPGARPKPTSKGPTGEDVATYWSYKSELMKWESSSATNYAHVESYFGEECAETFKTIRDDFETLVRQLDAAFYKRKTSLDFIEDLEVKGKVPPNATNDFRTKYFDIWNDLHANMIALSQDMIKAIQHGTVGSLGLPETNEAQAELKRLSPPKKNKPVKLAATR
ncbi:MAG TPA: hypothetical protein VIQ24_22030 [Pyrinomonadaceae bacterium]